MAVVASVLPALLALGDVDLRQWRILLMRAVHYSNRAHEQLSCTSLPQRAQQAGDLTMSGDRTESRMKCSPSIRAWMERDRTLGPMTLLIGSIDGGFLERTGRIDQEHVELLAQCADALPPIVVHAPSMRVIDGVHRLHAAKQLGRNAIDVEYFRGSVHEAFALSVHLNVGDGLPLPLDERKGAARTIVDQNPYWSDRVVASLTGLSHKTVASIRRSTGKRPQSNARLGRDGRTRPIDPVAGRFRAAKVLSENPDLPLRNVAQIAGIALATARDVRIRLEDGLSPLPAGLSVRGCFPGADEPAIQGRSAPTTGPARMDAARHNGRRGLCTDERSVATQSHLILERLRNDPAIRLNEAGRSLLRQLIAAHAAVAQCHELIAALPLHCATAVADLARNNAKAWRQLANDVCA